MKTGFVRVVVMDTEDGPMRIGQCTLCGWYDPEDDPLHTRENCLALRRRAEPQSGDAK